MRGLTKEEHEILGEEIRSWGMPLTEMIESQPSDLEVCYRLVARHLLTVRRVPGHEVGYAWVNVFEPTDLGRLAWHVAGPRLQGLTA